MRREDQILVEILADFVNGRSVRCLPDVSLEALYETAQKHNVAGIAAAMLLPVLKEQKKEDAYRTFQEVYMATTHTGHSRRSTWPPCTAPCCWRKR